MTKIFRSCASRGRSDGDWYTSEHRQKLELGSEIISNAVTGIQKDYMLMEQDLVLPEELRGKKYRIRKLTPRECFRLMGVDDKDINTIQATGISQSSMYRLAGNSIVVDVLFHLFRKLLIETESEEQQLTLF
jgi:DNA (cytosine-5)-methyltransferase 1